VLEENHQPPDYQVPCMTSLVAYDSGDLTAESWGEFDKARRGRTNCQILSTVITVLLLIVGGFAVRHHLSKNCCS